MLRFTQSRILYFALVSSVIAFNSVIWNPAKVDLIYKMYKGTNRFLGMIEYKIIFSGHLISNIERKRYLISLSQRKN